MASASALGGVGVGVGNGFGVRTGAAFKEFLKGESEQRSGLKDWRWMDGGEAHFSADHTRMQKGFSGVTQNCLATADSIGGEGRGERADRRTAAFVKRSFAIRTAREGREGERGQMRAEMSSVPGVQDCLVHF